MSIKNLIPMPLRTKYRELRSLAQLPYFSLKVRPLGDGGIRFMDNTEAVDLIVKNGMSMARFGDGEFGWVFQKDLVSGYQSASPELSQRLKEVLCSDEPRLLIGILKVLSDDSNMNALAKSHWRRYKAQNMQEIVSLLDSSKLYADASITRPYIDLKDRSGSFAEFENLKRIWTGRDVLLVEGDESQLGVGNDLFDRASSIRRILCPSRNAFESYDAILSAIMKYVRKGDLVLLALGPTATVLAYDLCREGVQAVDIGHIDNEYEWMRMGVKKKVPIPGKTVDELSTRGGGVAGDSRYANQIVFKIN